MRKTILIASIIAGIAIMLVLSTQTVYAPPQSPRAAFSFHGTTTVTGFEVDGGGSWVKGGTKISAGGTFLSSTTMGSWKATSLDMCGACAPSMTAPGTVIFSAEFHGADQTLFTKKVAVSATSNDLDGVAASGINFWVSGEVDGFGTAPNARFN